MRFNRFGPNNRQRSVERKRRRDRNVKNHSLRSGLRMEALEQRLLLDAEEIFTRFGASDEIIVEDRAEGGVIIRYRVGSGAFRRHTITTNPTDSLTIRAGDGNNKITIRDLGSDFTADIIIESGDGSDTIVVQEAIYGLSLEIATGSGDDTVTVKPTPILTNPDLDVVIDTGDGDDRITVTSVSAGTTILAAHGNDTIVFRSVLSGVLQSILYVNGEEGDDQFDIELPSGRVFLLGGPGADHFGLVSSSGGFASTLTPNEVSSIEQINRNRIGRTC